MPYYMDQKDALQFCSRKESSFFQITIKTAFKKTREYLLEKLCPENNDVIIISSSNDSFIAEISAKNSALWTMATN